MRRDQLEHVLRAASQIADAPDVVVIGSQSILATIEEDRLPLEATAFHGRSPHPVLTSYSGRPQLFSGARADMAREDYAALTSCAELSGPGPGR